MKRFLVTFALINVIASASCYATTIISGGSIEFTSPDDLRLDPATVEIAMDVYGDADRVVNGVTFQTDGQQDGVGTATSGAVTVTATAGNQINGWAAPPAFTGGTADSAANLAEIMSDIRWMNAPSPVTVDVTGLTPGDLYHIQLLFNEGGDRGRQWDMGVDGVLVADNWTSEGADGVWADNNSFAYFGVFDPGADGTLNIVLQQDIGGDPFDGLDGNPILQAVIVHRSAPPSPPDDIAIDPGEFTATVPTGTVVGTFTTSDPNGGSHTYVLAAGDGDTDNAKFQIVDDQLQTAFDFSALGGSTLSIRVRSTDDGGLFFEKIINVIANGDSDNDLLEDNWEMMFGTLADFTGLDNGPGPGAGTGDFDGDDSPDKDELAKGTDPTDVDSDDDGSDDGDESVAGTNPLDDDSDKDGLKDGDEVINMTDPLLPDSDGDTLLDGAEVTAGTDPNKKDTDEDGVDDNIDADPNDPNVISFTNVIVGEIIEFDGPDSLNLDPSTSVIAVNFSGDFDREVNGVTFLEDTSGGGTVTQDGVTVTTVATNQINDWAATTQFTGADATSTENLEFIMQSIRWSPASDPPVTIDISGLIPGAQYEIQLLTNEGRDRLRTWDIAVEDELVVDNYTSSGMEILPTGAWTTANSFAYVGEFEAPADGTLNVVMQQQFGGIEARPFDNNPIIQGIIVHQAGPGTPFVITNIDYDLASKTSTLTWNSRPGAEYVVDFSVDLLEPWIEIEDSIQSQGDSTTFKDDNIHPETKGFYRVRLAP